MEAIATSEPGFRKHWTTSRRGRNVPWRRRSSPGDELGSPETSMLPAFASAGQLSMPAFASSG
jgi:hypothetical protein